MTTIYLFFPNNSLLTVCPPLFIIWKCNLPFYYPLPAYVFKVSFCIYFTDSFTIISKLCPLHVHPFSMVIYGPSWPNTYTARPYCQPALSEGTEELLQLSAFHLLSRLFKNLLAFPLTPWQLNCSKTIWEGILSNNFEKSKQSISAADPLCMFLPSSSKNYNGFSRAKSA